MEAIALRPVNAVAVTTLVDNVTDSLLADQGPARRPSIGRRAAGPGGLFLGGDTDDALRGEHGFSALVTVHRRPAARPGSCSTPAARPTGWWRTCGDCGSTPATSRSSS